MSMHRLQIGANSEWLFIFAVLMVSQISIKVLFLKQNKYRIPIYTMYRLGVTRETCIVSP